MPILFTECCSRFYCRSQPIDVLTANLHLAAEFDVGAEEPYKVFTGLSLQEVQELHAAIFSMQVHLGFLVPMHWLCPSIDL